MQESCQVTGRDTEAVHVDRKIEIQKLERMGTFNRRFRPKCRRAVKSQVEIQKLCM